MGSRRSPSGRAAEFATTFAEPRPADPPIQMRYRPGRRCRGGQAKTWGAGECRPTGSGACRPAGVLKVIRTTRISLFGALNLRSIRHHRAVGNHDDAVPDDVVIAFVVGQTA